MTENLPAKTHTGEKLLGRLAAKYGVAPTALLATLRDTAFKVDKGEAFSDTELAAALVLCEKYDLNPFIRQIYITRSRGVLLPIIPIDGWSKIVNAQPGFDGVEFTWDGDGCTCKMYHKNRSRPTEVTEYLSECTQNTEPWKKWPKRMLRHKSYIQCARLAFGLSDAIDDDEAMRFVETQPAKKQTRTLELPKVGKTYVRPEFSCVPDARDQQEDRERPAEDAERVGLKKAFKEAWERCESVGLDLAQHFGITDEDGDHMAPKELNGLLVIMNETAAAMQPEEAKA